MRSICGIRRFTSNNAQPTERRRLTLRVLFGLLLIGALSAGCRPVVRGPSLSIGLAAPFEGAQRDLGYEVLAAVKLAIAEQNAAGGQRGRPIALIALNDEAEPAGAMTAARKLAQDPSVIGVIGHWSAQTTAAALPIYRAAGLPLVVPSAGPPLAGHPRVDPMAPTSPEVAAALIAFLRQRPQTQRLALHIEPADLAAPFETALRAAGYTLVAPGAPADIAALWLDDEATAHFLAGDHPPLVALLNGPYLPLLNKLHPLDAGVYTWTSDNAADAEFAGRFAAATGHPPSMPARYAYRAARALAGDHPDRLSIYFAPALALLAP